MLAAAPPAAASAAEMASHSDCHAPAARSCSCTRLPVSRPAAACARRAQASVRIDPTGFCLCGMVEDPPRPAPAGSATSPTSVWAISTTSSAIFASDPASIASADPRAATRTREVCQGSAGSARPRSPRDGRHDVGPALAEGCERAGRTAELDRQPVGGNEDELLGLEHAGEPRRRLQAERGGHRVLEQRSRDHRRLAVPIGELGADRGDGCHVGQHGCEGTGGDEHRGGVDDVLARRAVMHVPRRLAPDGGTERADERLGRIARPTALGCDAVGVEQLGPAGGGDRLGRLGGNHAELGLGRRERALEVEHRLQPRAVAHLVEQRLRREDRVEHQQTFYTFSRPT